ncbi:hypothetical protein ACWCY6_40020 [Streptomyces sp. 900105755]|uniref:hypothetical protein n=1 Tax=Streptomyces sp. NPDC001507 TaxID=3364579 RepID=UPI0036BF01A7
MPVEFPGSGMTVGVKSAYGCVKAFSETDLKEFDIQTLIIHGDDDQIMPIVASAKKIVATGQGRDLQGLLRCSARTVDGAGVRRTVQQRPP